jgi:hypothetical protein
MAKAGKSRDTRKTAKGIPVVDFSVDPLLVGVSASTLTDGALIAINDVFPVSVSPRL